MKSTKLLQKFPLFFFIFAAQISFAQLPDGFDIKKAYSDAQIKGIPASDIEGYVQFLHNDYISHKGGHGPVSGKKGDVLDLGTIYKSYNGSEANKPMSPMSPQNAYCPNAGFEQATFANWTGGYGTVSNGGAGAPFPTYNQTSGTIQSGAGNNVNLYNTINYHTIMTTPATSSVFPNYVGYDSLAARVIGTQTVSEIPVVNPNGGPASVRLNGAVSNYRASKLNYVMALNPNNKNFTISYALVLNNGGHTADDQPYFSVKVRDQNNNLVPGCSVYTVTCSPDLTNPASPLYDPTWANSINGFNDIMYRKWQTFAFDFSNYPSVTSVNVEFYVGGCAQGGHWGYAYVDAACSQGGAVASFCAGSSTSVLNAPGGYASYQWIGPSGPVTAANGGNTPTATISPVSAGQVFTCNVTAPNGCSSAFQTTIAITTVSITGIGSTPSCQNGNSGTANVSATGSSSGYTYQWLNSSGGTVSTNQTATGLSPGTYSIIVSSPLCGANTGTVAVGISAPTFYSLSAPYCGTTAWITQNGGSNYKWYTASPLAVIPGATSSSLTVNSPVNGASYFLVYTTASGCKDSIKYTLAQQPGGSIYVSNVKSICAGNSNSYGVVNLQTAAPPMYSYTVTGPSGYSSVLNNTTAIKDSVVGLSIGTYTAVVFDGQCLYNTTFTVSPFVYGYTLTPTTSTICAGGSTSLTVNFGNTTPSACGLSATGGCTSPNLIQMGSANNLNTNTSYPAIYSNWYKNARHQILYKANELLAAGILPGKISSIAFNISSISGTTSYPNFTIKMKCTSEANLSSGTFDNTGLTQVYFAPNINITTGWNTYTFPTAYEWDGVSNILIDVCTALTTNYTNNSISPYSITPFVSVRYFNSDGTVACMTTNSANTSSNRPNVKFQNCGGSNPNAFTYTWTPTTGLNPTNTYTTIASPVVTTVYTVQVNPIGQTNCMQAQSSTVTLISPVTPTITPVNPLCTNASSLALTVTPTGGTWAGSGVSPTGVFTPSAAIPGNNTYTYTIGSGTCSAVGNTTISVEKFIPSTITGSVAVQCITNPAVNLAPLTTFTTGTWTGPGVTGTTFDPATAGAGTHTLTYSTNSMPTPALCPSSSTMEVTVLSFPQPTITPVNPLCSNASSLALIATPSGGIWSGPAGVDAAGVFTPSVAPVGTNAYVYTIGTPTCSNSNTISISVEQFVPALITGSINPLCITDAPFDLSPLATNTLGVWTGNGVTGTMLDPAMAGAGTFTLVYSTNSLPTAALCPDDDSLVVTVISIAQPTITAVNPLCDNASPVVINATPTGGVWTGAGVDPTGVFTPSLAVVGSNTYTYTVGTGTCTNMSTTSISVEQFIPATLTGSISPQCITNPAVNLVPLTTATTGTWSGTGVTGTAFDPAAVITAGTYSLVHTTNSTSFLCQDTRTLVVSVSSVVQPTITPSGPYCTSYPLQTMSVDAAAVGGVWSSPNSQTNITSAGVFDPSSSLVGNNTIVYTLINGPCVKTDMITVNVVQFVPATLLGILGPYCSYEAPVNLQNIAVNAGGVWAGTGVNGTLFTPSPSIVGTQTVTYTTDPVPAGLCPDTKSILIKVNPKPEITPLGNITFSCNPLTVNYFTNSTNSGSGLWNFGDGSVSEAGLSVSHTYTNPGVYTAVLSYTSNEGCKDTTTAVSSVTVFAVPHADFDASPNITTVVDGQVEFINTTSNLTDNTYSWDFGGLAYSYDVNPTYLFTVSGEFFVTVVATSPEGCQDSETKKVTVNPDVVLYVPNAFTPGGDGLNDQFQIFLPPTGVDYSTFSLTVYDRWGSVIYQTNDVNKFWNGAKNNSGDIVKADTYVYKISFEDENKKYYEKLGYVTLLRK